MCGAGHAQTFSLTESSVLLGGVLIVIQLATSSVVRSCVENGGGALAVLAFDFRLFERARRQRERPHRLGHGQPCAHHTDTADLKQNTNQLMMSQDRLRCPEPEPGCASSEYRVPTRVWDAIGCCRHGAGVSVAKQGRSTRAPVRHESI